MLVEMHSSNARDTPDLGPYVVINYLSTIRSVPPSRAVPTRGWGKFIPKIIN